MRNKENSTIIGGADGPTSVFIVGKTGKRSLKDRAGSYVYQKKRGRVAKKIVPGAHSLEEVAAYIKEKYGATEVPETAHKYKEQKASLKEGLIIQNRPDLLGDLAEISPPEEMTDEDSGSRKPCSCQPVRYLRVTTYLEARMAASASPRRRAERLITLPSG